LRFPDLQITLNFGVDFLFFCLPQWRPLFSLFCLLPAAGINKNFHLHIKINAHFCCCYFNLSFGRLPIGGCWPTLTKKQVKWTFCPNTRGLTISWVFCLVFYITYFLQKVHFFTGAALWPWVDCKRQAKQCKNALKFCLFPWTLWLWPLHCCQENGRRASKICLGFSLIILAQQFAFPQP